MEIMQPHSFNVLKRIISLLRANHTPYRVSGGLAANLYGSLRPLADIDIDVPDNRIKDIAVLLKDHIVAGPNRYKDNEWDVLALSTKYQGQEVDFIGADSQKIHDKRTDTWVKLPIDFTTSNEKTINGVRINVIPKDELIAYKSAIRRDVDLLDVEALSKKK